MDKLLLLMSKCKCSVSLEVNKNRDFYMSTAEYIQDISKNYQLDNEDIPENIKKEMIKRDTIIELQFYPNTPIGSYSIYHYDLNMALDEALSCFYDVE